ncbi:MAG: hypothetical protein JNN20_06555 [Betaproteobacteria bacterium]|nr:hypothetical protein [Betaproteobacteria bacterium]
MTTGKLPGINFSRADRIVLSVVAPLVWIMVGVDAIFALQGGRYASAVADVGLLMMTFCAMIGPHMWKLVDPQNDGALGKVVSMVTLLGFLMLCTGLVARMLS